MNSTLKRVIAWTDIDEIILDLPVQTKGVEEGGETLHQDENGHGEQGPRGEYYEDHGRSDVAVNYERLLEDHAPEHLGKFCKGRFYIALTEFPLRFFKGWLLEDFFST